MNIKVPELPVILVTPGFEHRLGIRINANQSINSNSDTKLLSLTWFNTNL